MATKPACLHIPALYESMPATILWGAEDGDGYELDCVFDQSFEEAGEDGLTWANLNARDDSWAVINAAERSWREFSQIPTSYLIYRGPGMPYGGGTQEHRLTWQELHALDRSWQDIRDADLTWYQFERRERDGQPHFFHEVVIPKGRKFAYYRVRAYAESGGVTEYSAYETSARIPILPYLVKEGELLLWAEPGKVSEVQASFGDVLDEFENVILSVTYNPSALEFVDAAVTETGSIPTGRIREVSLTVDDQESGTLMVSCARGNIGDYRSGLLAVLRFRGLAAGDTAVTLR